MARYGTVKLAADDQVNADRFDLKHLEQLPARNVAISSLVPGVYLRRRGTNAVHVQLLLGVAGSSGLPPILVQEHGSRVIDGLHRLEATKLRGDETISARFLDCTDEEALVLAIKSNTTHGLPLSRADRMSGAKRVLQAHPDWSDRAIADITGLSGKTIASLRDRSNDRSQLNDKRLGRDGRRRPVSAVEGRRRAAEYIRAHPDASMRQVVRETDVSLGTVHDVATRIRRGIDPHGKDAQASGVAEILGQAAQLFPGTSPAVTGTPTRRKKYADVSPTWATVSPKVANDPAVRYTKGGKEFLRWMALHAAYPDQWREFIDAIPVHWLSVIAPIAEDLGSEWSLFAERLRSKHGAGS